MMNPLVGRRSFAGTKFLRNVDAEVKVLARARSSWLRQEYVKMINFGPYSRIPVAVACPGPLTEPRSVCKRGLNRHPVGVETAVSLSS
jgi:hypothetical protein